MSPTHNTQDYIRQIEMFHWMAAKCTCAQSLSHVWLFATPCTVACQASMSMRFSRQEYWSGLPCCPPRDLPNPGIEPTSSALARGIFTTEPLRKPSVCVKWINMRYQYTQHSNIQKNSSELLLFPSCYPTIPFVKAAAKAFTTTAQRFLQAETPKEVEHSFLSFWISK